MSKSIGELTSEDLTASPVWEWVGEPDSGFVRPTSLTSLSEYREGPVHIAATRYISTGGKTFFGYCSPADASGLDYVQPVALTANGPLPLWKSGGLSPQDVATLSSALSSDSSTLFPVRLECLVPVDGALYVDTIDAA